MLPTEFVKEEIEPFVTVRSIDKYGLLTIDFSVEMDVITDLKSIDNTVLNFQIETVDLDKIYMRKFYWDVTEYN